ncbi:serine/threonine-protein kinase PAK 4-like [Athene cunicularia]|uniref:serine/threonine-protein kinase PAK 4-like n=1 Tax=Athene cunicularia TaxID=194338 RepID=UPI000EF6EC6E|nr:serine/threonine-protein kinase PAK 4-like [Athene cunicularia]
MGYRTVLGVRGPYGNLLFSCSIFHRRIPACLAELEKRFLFLAGLLAGLTMFGRKKKRIEISAPSNFEHRVHTGYDQQEQKFTGLPRQWQGIIEDSAKRPKPLVDPVCITTIQHSSQKVGSSASVATGPLRVGR